MAQLPPHCEKYHNIKMMVCQPMIFLIFVLKANSYFCRSG